LDSEVVRTFLPIRPEDGNKSTFGTVTIVGGSEKYIGAYLAAMGGLDTLIFTGGIGENSIDIRARICHGMQAFGIMVFDDINTKMKAQRGRITDISEPASKIRILVVPADEEKMIARENGPCAGPHTFPRRYQKLSSRPIVISTSAHHVHLTQKHFEMLSVWERP